MHSRILVSKPKQNKSIVFVFFKILGTSIYIIFEMPAYIEPIWQIKGNLSLKILLFIPSRKTISAEKR